jgi:hypothetical protein
MRGDGLASAANTTTTSFSPRRRAKPHDTYALSAEEPTRQREEFLEHERHLTEQG